MISGAFHVMSQEWRYYAREKSLIHTLHLGELPASVEGQTVLIDSVPPVAQSDSNFNGKFSVPPLNLPMSNGGLEKLTFTTNTLSTCFGSVGINKAILAQRNSIIQFGVWDSNLQEFLITPQESGWYYCYVDAQSDVFNSNGVFAPTYQISVTVKDTTKSPTSREIAQNSVAVSEGAWTDAGFVGMYVINTLVTRASGIAPIAKGSAIRFAATGLGLSGLGGVGGYVSGYLWKMADIP